MSSRVHGRNVRALLLSSFLKAQFINTDAGMPTFLLSCSESFLVLQLSCKRLLQSMAPPTIGERSDMHNENATFSG